MRTRIIYDDFEIALIKVITDMKEQLSSIDDSYLSFNMHVNGRVDGDIKIDFSVSKGYGSDGVNATGGKLEAVVTEYIRRVSWGTRHAPLCLPNVDTSQDRRIDEILDELEDEKNNG